MHLYLSSFCVMAGIHIIIWGIKFSACGWINEQCKLVNRTYILASCLSQEEHKINNVLMPWSSEVNFSIPTYLISVCCYAVPNTVANSSHLWPHSRQSASTQENLSTPSCVWGYSVCTWSCFQSFSPDPSPSSRFWICQCRRPPELLFPPLTPLHCTVWSH